MTVPKPSHPTRSKAGARAPDSFMGKIRQRGILGTLAAFLGSGWLAYEIVHFILVEHYHLPEWLKDITIIAVVCATLSALTRRWFQGEKKTRKPKWERILIPAFILVAVAAGVKPLLRPGSAERTVESAKAAETGWTSSVAVLPFVNMSADREQEYFCDGLTEELITKLSQVEALKVPARTSAFAFKGQGRDVREVGKALGVAAILEGSVRKDGPRLRIVVQLINVSDGFHIWSRTYDRDLGRIFQIQDDIARSVAGTLKISLLDLVSPLHQTKSLQAYDEYLQGRYDYANPSRENLKSAGRHFSKAVEIDPDYARAWAALGGTIAFQASVGHVPVEGNYEKAAAAIDRALSLDDRLAAAYMFKGWMLMSFDWDWKGADEAYTKALEIEPGSGLIAASQLALGLGRFERAISLARKAADLDALNATAHMNLGFGLFCAGRLEEARGLFEQALSLNPSRGNVRALLAQILLLQSRPAEALPMLEKESDPLFRLPVQAMVFHALGRSGEARETLEKYIGDYRFGNAYQVAQIQAFLGNPDQAFKWLEAAYEQHDGGLFLAKVDPLLRALKSDPRFAAFLEKMRIPPDRP